MGVLGWTIAEAILDESDSCTVDWFSFCGDDDDDDVTFLLYVSGPVLQLPASWLWVGVGTNISFKMGEGEEHDINE